MAEKKRLTYLIYKDRIQIKKKKHSNWRMIKEHVGIVHKTRKYKFPINILICNSENTN